MADIYQRVIDSEFWDLSGNIPRGVQDAMSKQTGIVVHFNERAPYVRCDIRRWHAAVARGAHFDWRMRTHVTDSLQLIWAACVEQREWRSAINNGIVPEYTVRP